MPSFCHIPKKRTALPCKILAETASAWRTITHEKDHARCKSERGDSKLSPRAWFKLLLAR